MNIPRVIPRYLKQAMAVVWLCGGIAPLPASAQTSGTAHAVAVRGDDSEFRLTGFAAGGGILFQDRFGVDAEYGLFVDDSDERSVASAMAGGASLHVPLRGKLTPFLTAGLARVGSLTGPYVGAGANYWFTRDAALRAEFRSMFPTADNRPCVSDPRTPCAARGTGWSIRAGVTVGIGR